MKIDKHEIILGDCFEHLKTIDDLTIDIVTTSPPYNIGTRYNSYSDKQPREAYLQWMKDIGKEISRVLKPNGAFFLNIGSTNIDPWIGYDVAQKLRDIFFLQNNIIWVKSISINEDTVGHFKPISSQRFLNHNHENIFHFTLTGQNPVDRLAIGVPFKDKGNIARRGHTQDKRCAGNVRYIPYETVQSKSQKFNHPAGFPIAIPEFCIKMHGSTEGIVLDPFVGIGTTLIAAHRLGHQGIGIDIDEQYVNIAIERMQQECELRPQSAT